MIFWNKKKLFIIKYEDHIFVRTRSNEYYCDLCKLTAFRYPIKKDDGLFYDAFYSTLNGNKDKNNLIYSHNEIIIKNIIE